MYPQDEMLTPNFRMFLIDALLFTDFIMIFFRLSLLSHSNLNWQDVGVLHPCVSY